jgi:hypothetical protein
VWIRCSRTYGRMLAISFADGQGHMLFYLLWSKSEVPILTGLVLDHLGGQTSSYWKRGDKYSQWLVRFDWIRMEREIQVIKGMMKRWTRKRQFPKCLWDFCNCLAATVWCLFARDCSSFDGRTPYHRIVQAVWVVWTCLVRGFKRKCVGGQAEIWVDGLAFRRIKVCQIHMSSFPGCLSHLIEYGA